MVTSRNYGDYYPYGISVAVRNCEYASDVNIGHPYIANFGAPLALNTTGILVTGALTTGVAGTFTASAAQVLNGGLVPHDSLTKRNGWGRNVTIVASAASTRVCQINGYDYLGQKMSENLTGNGTTPVVGVKAFQWIDNVVCGASADVVSISVGYGNVFGFPYTFQHLIAEDKNYAVAANAGTFVVGLGEGVASTGTTADTRGTYLPVTVIPDGVQIFEVTYMVRRGNLHGNAQFSN